jgi:glycine/D-amino acid oxidase-like deaminating enzyme/nitrite reductase/ring-hydroxylating ferredoxin subunit
VARFGEEGARAVIASVWEAIDEIERRAAQSDGGCGFLRLPGFRFAEDPERAESFASEAELARSLGLDAHCVEDVPLPFACAQAIRFERQAQLDPLPYLVALARQVVAKGGRIFEQTAVTEVADDGVGTAAGPRVAAKHVVEATHTPIGLAATIQTRVTAFTSYVLAARLDGAVGRALYWDCADPYHYVRTVGDESCILVGGEDHRTGRERDPAARLDALEAWTRARFPVRSVEARWSHELFEPADGLPYVGLLPGARSRLVASGFAGTGMTFGTVAARVLCDLVTRGASPWEALYSPSRLKPLASGLPVAEENLRIGWRFVADRLRRRSARVRDLAPDAGCVERIDGRQVAVYRDPGGALHFLSPRCTHLGCIVAWNDLEKTWDCPCHGGRFDPTGKVLYGPPTADLEHEAPGEGERGTERRR